MSQDDSSAAETISRLQDENKKLKSIIQHAVAERTGLFFICGEIGEKDNVGLPEKIMVCPSFGLDGFAIYTKSTSYSAPSY